MNYKYGDYIEDNMAIHRFDYAFMNRVDAARKTEDVINWLKLILRCANVYACNVKGLDESIPKYAAWKKAAYTYYNATTERQKNWGLICAAFGYAIEEYVNIRILGGGYPHASEFNLEIQMREKRTIPDVRIFKISYDKAGNPINTEVAWIDITSMGSVRHIYKKRSPDWLKKPIVIELVYPALDFSNLNL